MDPTDVTGPWSFMLTCECVCLSVRFQVQETKAELSGLGDRIEEVRSVCRQLQAHLRQIPECNPVSFEGEADALMDRWLDVSSLSQSCCCSCCLRCASLHQSINQTTDFYLYSAKSHPKASQSAFVQSAKPLRASEVQQWPGKTPLVGRNPK